MIDDLTQPAAASIAANLCARDRREVLAVLPATGVPEDVLLRGWVADLLLIPKERRSFFSIWEGLTPIAMGGIIQNFQLEHLAQIWCVGTPGRFGFVPGSNILVALQRLHKVWDGRGIRRYEARCLESPELSSEILERLGYTFEGLVRGLGRNGENFKQWGRVK